MAGRGAIRPVEHLISPAVEQALAAAVLSPEDAATAALARRYARELDDSAVIRADLVRVLREVYALDRDVHDRLLPLATRIEDVTVAATVGPKLLAALEALGASPRARAAISKGKTPGTGSSKLAALRSGRVG